MKYLSRPKACVMACKLTRDEVRQLVENPKMDLMDVLEWQDGFGNYIESAYTGRHQTLKAIADDFTANIHRKFKQITDGKIVNYYRLLQDYLNHMFWITEGSKGYTKKAFNDFIKNNYTEVFA